MTDQNNDRLSTVAKNAIQAFDDLAGRHPGCRPTHAKGILLSGHFTPSESASSLTRAVHMSRSSTPVSARFSNFTGIPDIPDNNPDAAPRGLAVRFHLADHVHTDIVSHSVDGFPTRTAEEFTDFLRAAHDSTIGEFLAAHPAALRFVQVPKPVPASFARECYFSVSAAKFVNRDGVARFGRYRIRPAAGTAYLDDAAAAQQAPDFLLDEIRQRLSSAPVEFRIWVQLAEAQDIVDDSTVAWPEGRPEIELGVLTLAEVVPQNEAEQRHIIFDPIPRLDGIESSGDPLLEPRAAIYLISGRRRRADFGEFPRAQTALGAGGAR